MYATKRLCIDCANCKISASHSHCCMSRAQPLVINPIDGSIITKEEFYCENLRTEQSEFCGLEGRAFRSKEESDPELMTCMGCLVIVAFVVCVTYAIFN